MKKYYLILFLFTIYSNAQTIGLTQYSTDSLDDGYVLFAPIGSTTTYLIDKCGKEINTWSSNYRPAMSSYLLPDGSLLRPGNTNNTTFTAGGKGGIIQKINWTGNTTWSYTISNSLECQHHDIKALPNGNVLAIVWESRTNTEAIANGRNPSLVSTTLWSEKIVEIQPLGINAGNIVWEWYLWDHLVQDYDNTKPNYNTISTNPQLVDINYNASVSNQDWIHLNSIDYNASLDQIVLSSHGFDEIWIIDHSTTTAQAASHIGGNSGKGGDILFRWGNPQTYDNGNNANQKLFGQHNAHWIESGLPFENQIMIFNNGNGRTGGNYSTVEIINPPLTGFNYTPTLPYFPTTTSWNYNNGNPNNLYAPNISGAQQLSNGNVLFCDGPKGIFTEITTTGSTVWDYVNPVTPTGIENQGATNIQYPVFRCTFYPANYSGFNGHDLTPGTIIENSNSLSETCSTTLNNSLVNDSDKVIIYPNPAQDLITINLNHSNADKIEIYNSVGQIVFQLNNPTTENTIPTQRFSNGMYFIKVTSENDSKSFKIIKQ